MTTWIVGGVLPYVAATVFVLGVVYRMWSWRRLAQPGPMTLYPTKGSSCKELVKEALFFPSLFRGDKTLWSFAWSFHVALALAFIGHVRLAMEAIDGGLTVLPLRSGAMASLAAAAGSCAGLVLLSCLLLLLGRRIFVARVREISAGADYFALLLLVAVITSGMVMRFAGAQFHLATARAWLSSLFAFAPVVPASPALVVHLFCAELLVLYVAFSKLMHFGGFFLTFPLIKRTGS